jgi:hypothetical protein
MRDQRRSPAILRLAPVAARAPRPAEPGARIRRIYALKLWIAADSESYTSKTVSNLVTCKTS